MKFTMVLLFCFTASIRLFAQTGNKDYRSVPEIIAIKDTISFEQKTRTGMAIFSLEKPDEVIETETHATLLFRKYNSKITLTKEVYANYRQRIERLENSKLVQAPPKIKW
ncbi:MAG TPA: hypothetical protein VGE18_01670 [Candidatus Paceibacterota bacterium]